jgi:hypothetical protein
MRDIQLFLRLLAARVYEAQPPLRDVTDFHAWLLKCSEVAGSSTTMETFFNRLS